MHKHLILLVALFAACAPETEPTGFEKPEVESPKAPSSNKESEYSFYRDIKPILDKNCTQCHSRDSIGPIDLTDPESVNQWKNVIVDQIVSEQMPPWPPDEECNTYVDERRLTDADVETVTNWSMEGGALGDSNDNSSTPKQPGGLSRVDTELQLPEAYQPEPGDDYRCFAIPWDGDKPVFITGYELRPTNPAVVHHVNVFIIDAERADAQLRRQENSPGPGYECFGGQFDAGTSLLGSWVPGITQRDFPDNSGILIEPGSVVMLEMHFNTSSGNSDPDQSKLALKLEAEVEKRAMVAAFWNFSKWNGSGGMLIPAGSESTIHSYSFDPKTILPNYAPWLTSDTLQIHAVGLHMHYLGQRGRLEIKKYSGKKECLLDIQDWDFNWQSGYFLKTPVSFEVGKDKMYLECEWDNSDDNQPIVNGARRSSRDVVWGSKSADEMCIGLFYITE